MTFSLSHFQIAATELNALGISLTIHPGTYGVNYRGANAMTMYFSDDLDDAVEHGRAMAAESDQAPYPRVRYA
jgi:hypothetical protein